LTTFPQETLDSFADEQPARIDLLPGVRLRTDVTKRAPNRGKNAQYMVFKVIERLSQKLATDHRQQTCVSSS